MLEHFYYNGKVKLYIFLSLLLWFALVTTQNLLSQEWIAVHKGTGKIGMSDFAFSQLHFPDANNGWAVSTLRPDGEIFIYTKDGGLTWNEVVFNDESFSPDEVAIVGRPRSVYFLNAQEGWIGGLSTVAHTTDGGKTWQVIKVDYEGRTPGVYLAVKRIYFANSQEGWVAGYGQERTNIYGGFILHTIDGGKSWEAQIPISISSNPGRFYALDFIRIGEGWIGGEDNRGKGVLRYTHDGGLNWDALPDLPDDILDINFVDSQNGWTVIYNFQNPYYIYHTTDGGHSWSGQSLPDLAREKLKGGILYALSFINNQTSWAVGSYGVIVHTKDGGETWQLEESGIGIDPVYKIPIDLVDIQYVLGNGIFALATDGTILKRENVTSIGPKNKLPITWGKIKRI